MSRERPLRGLRGALVLGAPEVGGAEKQAMLLGRHLVEREGMEVEVWALQPGSGSLREPLRQAGLPGRELDFTIPPHFAGRAALVASLARQLRQARIDVLLPFTTFPNLLTGLAFRLSGAQVCVWNERVADPTLVATRSHRLAASLCSVFIANSRAGAALCTTLYGAPPGRVHVVRNGLALAPALEGRAAHRARLGVNDGTFVATMIANVHERKDHATLLRAWALATPDHRPGDSLLVCAGDAVDEALRKLLALAAELGIADRVLFPGRVTDVAGLLEATDLAVFASHAEGTPNGVLESMAKRLPVIASDLPGIRDALGEASARWLVPARDAEGFAERLRLLMADPALRASVGRQNQAIIAADFSAEQMGARSAEIIAAALQRGPGLHLPRFPALPRSPWSRSSPSSPSIRSPRS